MPQREATFTGLSVCSQYFPCSGIGGDLFDYAAADSGQTALLVADVSGHGLSAAMMTSVVKSAFHAARVDRYDPLTVVHRVWSSLAAFGPEKFVTLFAALIGRRTAACAMSVLAIRRACCGRMHAILCGWRARAR